MAENTSDNQRRRKILKTLFISLLLDLISFTFILPLFPSLIRFYLEKDPSPSSFLNRILQYLNAYKNAFSKPIDSKYDVVLLGGALGSLFSLLQAVAAPVIGSISDKHGRRAALLWSMAGNIASVALWVAATDFRTFLGSRIIGGLSEGNVQIANAIAADISDPNERGSTMALVGACFSVAFTIGPAIGAALSSITIFAANPFATAAACSLFLIVTETIYIYFCLPETHPRLASKTYKPATRGDISGKEHDSKPGANRPSIEAPRSHTNNPFLLNIAHFLFLLPFSGLEFSLPFITASLYETSLAANAGAASLSSLNGRLLSVMGLLASILQGGVTRRLPPLLTVRIGVVACAISFAMLAHITTITGLYAAGCLLAVTSATVVTGLNSLGSLEAREAERGASLGRLRSWGQAGRAAGPVLFCSLFWWGGREVAYKTGALAMAGVCAVAFGLLKSPMLAKTK
ncbi:tetracycline transporter [Trichophyton tonsurans CBS 112818]|uniref:Tetracycline transporter n=1 Tax=Trichophyton tonsurans (strain CBS 112818) TaxID=647933 RepID=F2RY43_TRIT1|nr:tetracycline transporter [Trichophyton tonsurans CBS 112818]